MNCPNCSSIAADGQQLCEKCGTALPLSGAARQGAPAHRACLCPRGESQLDSGGFCEACGFRVSRTVIPLEFDIDHDLGLVSDIGRHHPVNQDAGMALRSQNGSAIIVVADGVSSSDRAEIASSTAVSAACKTMNEAMDYASGLTIVHRAVNNAHACVLDVPHTNLHMEEPETTIIVALVRGACATIAWVGDSRAYLVGESTVRLLTRDDSWLADIVEDGIMTNEEAHADRRAHSITQCLGMRDTGIQIHTCDVELAPGERLLVCSDGLWNYFDAPATLAQAVNSIPANTSAIGICRHLVGLANSAGGRDNITVAVYRF